MRAGRPYFQSHRGNVASGRRAKTPGSKAAHRHALRATNPFKTRVAPVFSRKLQKNGNAALKGLVAQRYRLLAGDLAATVCGASPPNKPTRGRVFLLAGAAKFIRLPPACSVPPGWTLAGGFGRRKLAISSKWNLLTSRHFLISAVRIH